MRRSFAFGMMVLLVGTVGALSAYAYHSTNTRQDVLKVEESSADPTPLFYSDYWQSPFDYAPGIADTSLAYSWLWDDALHDKFRPPLAAPDDPFGWNTFAREDEISPDIHIEDQDHAFLVRLEVPNIRENSIEVKLEAAQRVRIEAETASTPSEVLDTLSTGRFVKTLSLPGPVEKTPIQSEYADGILTVKIPKANQS